VDPTRHPAETLSAGIDRRQPRLSRVADLALRAIAIVCLIGGAAIGFGHPLAIALIAAGLLLLILGQVLAGPPPFKRRPRRPVPGDR
jgi:hypothetical protein